MSSQRPLTAWVVLLLLFVQVSIEMIEAVGHEHLPSYFATINAALKPGGKAVIQVTLAVMGVGGQRHQLAVQSNVLLPLFCRTVAGDVIPVTRHTVCGCRQVVTVLTLNG